MPDERKNSSSLERRAADAGSVDGPNGSHKARDLATAIKCASKDGVLEKPFRAAVEKHLIGLAEAEGIELVPHTEITLGTSGRLDTIYNRFILEWKQPGLLTATNNSTANSKAIAQVKGYVQDFWFSNRQAPGRVVGCCTDGRFFIFATKPGHEWDVKNPVAVNEQSCRRFLDYFFALNSDIALLPEYLAEDFSSENERTKRAVRALYQSLEKHASSPSLSAVFDQWAQFFGAVTEYEQWSVKLANETELRRMVKAFGIPQDKLDLNRFFFATHTFFAILTKLLAYVIVGRYTDLPTPPLKEWKNLTNDKLVEHFAALEKGGPFHAAGIRNFLEGDFFAWYVKYFTPELAACLKAVVERLADYDPATLDLAPGPTQDMLKKLYHRLVSPHIRKALGEFYTPDWLAQRLLNMLDGGRFQGDPQKRLLDPTCGSGTFVVQTINAIRTNSIAQSMDSAELLRTICQNVVGIDLNPLAVIAARTNYLLALGPLLKFRGAEPLEIPVYLADSVMTPSRGDTHDLFETDKVRVWLSIGKVELPLRLASQRGVAALTHLLDEYLEKTPSTPPAEFTGLAEKRLKESYSASKLKEQGLTPDEAWKKDEATIAALYARLHELHAAGRNGLWARIIKNAFAPVFLAPFDYVAGNPPWINWQNLPEGYRKETKDLWVQHGLFVHSGMDTILGKGKKDISTLVTYVAADSYLKTGGKLGFVITQAVFKTSGAGQGFRRFITRSKEPLAVTWVDDFSELQIFEGASTRPAVFILRKGQPTKYPVQYAYWRKKESGRKGKFDYDSTLQEVTDKTERMQFVAEPVSAQDVTSAWLTGRRKAIEAVRKLLGKSGYDGHAGTYTGGANAVYWFEILKDHADGTVTARNITEGAKRSIESVQVRLEKALLYPQLRGRDVTRWRQNPTAFVLFVQDVKTRRGIEEAVLKTQFPLAHKWLAGNRKMLEERAAYRRYFDSATDPFYSMFDVGDYTLAPFKVVWLGFGARRVNAAISEYVDEKPVCGNQAMHIMIACDSLDEARFVAGCINSSPFNAAVVMHTQIGGKSFAQGSILKSVRLPKFDEKNAAHRKVVEAVRDLHKHLDDESTLRLHEEKLDDAVRAVWGLDKDELAAARQVCEELSGVDFEGEEQPGTEE